MQSKLKLPLKLSQRLTWISMDTKPHNTPIFSCQTLALRPKLTLPSSTSTNKQRHCCCNSAWRWMAAVLLLLLRTGLPMGECSMPAAVNLQLTDNMSPDTLRLQQCRGQRTTQCNTIYACQVSNLRPTNCQYAAQNTARELALGSVAQFHVPNRMDYFEAMSREGC